MSYILDALRRAEAERSRERQTPPDLHAPMPWPGTAAPASAATPRRWGGLTAAVVAGAGLSGLAVWLWMRPVDAGAPGGAPPQASPAVAVVQGGLDGQASAAPSLAAPPAQAIPTAPPPAPTTAPPEATRSQAGPLSPRPPLPSPPKAGPIVPPAGAAPVGAAVPVETGRPLPTQRELPASVQRELPRLSLGGSVFSDDRASRFLILNGEVVHEGAQIGPDLVLEQIQAREAIFRYRDTRWRLPL